VTIENLLADAGPDRFDRRHPELLDPPLAYCPEEAARKLGLSRTTTFAEIASGRLRSFKVGKRRLVPSSALGPYIEERLAESGASHDARQRRRNAAIPAASPSRT
jgi:excisionase family DNA binding protein